jgi:hypothetical protein
VPFGVSMAQSLEEYGDIHEDILFKISPSLKAFWGERSAHTDSFIGKSIIVVLPAELRFDVTARSQALACFDDLQVGDFVEVDVSRSIEVFLGDQDTFYEELAIKFILVA